MHPIKCLSRLQKCEYVGYCRLVVKRRASKPVKSDNYGFRTYPSSKQTFYPLPYESHLSGNISRLIGFNRRLVHLCDGITYQLVVER